MSICREFGIRFKSIGYVDCPGQLTVTVRRCFLFWYALLARVRARSIALSVMVPVRYLLIVMSAKARANWRLKLER